MRCEVMLHIIKFQSFLRAKRATFAKDNCKNNYFASHVC